MTLDERVAAARAACTDALPRPRTTMAEELRALAALPEADSGDQDVYGDGGPVAELERRVAQLLGTDTAVFFLSGIMAQQAALRTWCDRTGSRRVALPDLSHLLVHEEDGPRLLHDLEVVHLTTGARTPTADDVRAVPGHVAAVLVEVPLRDGGYLVPDLDELRMLSAACRERSIALHLDGARLWEAAAGLGCEPSDLARTAHSTYVSFYKGLGGMAGAAVGCDEDAADELRLWRRRLGGTIFTAYPWRSPRCTGWTRCCRGWVSCTRTPRISRSRWTSGGCSPARRTCARWPSEPGSRARRTRCGSVRPR